MCFTPHMARPLADTPLAEWLRTEIDAREGWGIRTLARRMNPEEPEIARRCLNRVLYEGADPSPANRALIAEGLGVAVAEVPAASPFQNQAA
jgi:hypothetical protein